MRILLEDRRDVFERINDLPGIMFDLRSAERNAVTGAAEHFDVVLAVADARTFVHGYAELVAKTLQMIRLAYRIVSECVDTCKSVRIVENECVVRFRVRDTEIMRNKIDHDVDRS